MKFVTLAVKILDRPVFQKHFFKFFPRAKRNLENIPGQDILEFCADDRLALLHFDQLKIKDLAHLILDLDHQPGLELAGRYHRHKNSLVVLEPRSHHFTAAFGDQHHVFDAYP